MHRSFRTRSSVHEYLSCKINCKTKHKSHALYQGHGRLASRLGTDPDQTLIGSLCHAHTSRVNNCLMSYVHRQPRWSWYMDKLSNKQVNHFHEKLQEFLLWGNILRDQVYSDTQEKMPEKFGYRQFCRRCEQEESALLRNQKVVTAL